MLMVGRQNGQGIRIAEDVFVFVRFQNGRVRMRIDAPKSVPVVRCELADVYPELPGDIQQLVDASGGPKPKADA